jgi:hypothetical protein
LRPNILATRFSKIDEDRSLLVVCCRGVRRERCNINGK